jgi:predicted enzyme involved in methoxymalonyl-ACP biosynthesis
LNLLAAAAKRLGARRLIGEYIPTAKNGMVKEHYPKLGFAPLDRRADHGASYVLDLPSFAPAETFISVREG